LQASQELGKAASKLAAMDLSKNGAAAANRNVLSSMR
jgi:hypothetical protein